MLPAANGFALVSPASRGLGFAFAQQLLAQTPVPVIATARKNCDEVRERLLSRKSLPPNAERRLRILKVDVTGIARQVAHSLLGSCVHANFYVQMNPLYHQ